MSEGTAAERPERPVQQSWLALRSAADTIARDAGSAPLLAALQEDWAAHRVERVAVVDLGAGTGANRSYLEPRLGLPQSWTVLDHDPEHLAHPGHGDAMRVCAGIADLPAVLAARTPEPGTALLVTCAALLDVLHHQELTLLVEAAAEAGADLLLSLSVDGTVQWDPAQEGDELLAQVFDSHQQRDGRPGPQASGVVADLLEERGREVRTAATPWVLTGEGSPDGPADGSLLRRFLDERVSDALEVRPEQRAALEHWQQLRHAELETGVLRVRVGHTDLLSGAGLSRWARAR